MGLPSGPGVYSPALTLVAQEVRRKAAEIEKQARRPCTLRSCAIVRARPGVLRTERDIAQVRARSVRSLQTCKHSVSASRTTVRFNP